MVTEHISEIKVGKRFAQPLYEIVYLTTGKKEDGESLSSSVILPPGIPTRDEIINAVITDKYPRDKMEATINNYLLDPDDVENKADMDSMQAWRKYAKGIADEFIGWVNNDNN